MFESPLQNPEFGTKYAELGPLAVVATMVVAETNRFDLVPADMMLDPAAAVDSPPAMVERRAF